MHDRPRNRTLRCLAMLVGSGLAAASLTGCGAAPNRAAGLLRATFTASHRVTSGTLGLTVTLAPSGHSALKGPVSLSLGGPFQSLGPGRLPRSDFTLRLGTGSGSFALAIVSTGSQGFVTLHGASYRLPPATFRRLESSFAQLGSAPGTRGGTGVLAKLGIQPEHWLVDARVLGNEMLNGTKTTHIRAGIDASALLADLDTFLKHASTVGVSGADSLPQGLSEAARSQITGEIHGASIDVWTGAADRTLRRLDLRLTLALSGQGAVLFGPSTGLRVSMQYAQLNQPHAIVAPSAVLPYGQFQDRLRVLLADLQGSLSGG